MKKIALLSFLFFILALKRKGVVFFVFYIISSIAMPCDDCLAGRGMGGVWK